jgi:hypothetical protein
MDLIAATAITIKEQVVLLQSGMMIHLPLLQILK